MIILELASRASANFISSAVYLKWIFIPKHLPIHHQYSNKLISYLRYQFTDYNCAFAGLFLKTKSAV
ncbi:hypothetical protein [Aquirufa ecclesiirivi]